MNQPNPHSVRRYRSIFSMALILALAACLQLADAGLDKGTFDIIQMAQPQPTAWAWAPNGTSGGNGVHYVAFVAGHQHAGAGAPSLTETTNYQAGTNHGSLQDFVNWVVATNPNVNTSADLTIYRYDVSTVSVP